MKPNYIAPTLEVYEFAVECATGLSPIQTTEFIGDVSIQNEEVVEGNNYNIFNDDIWY